MINLAVADASKKRSSPAPNALAGRLDDLRKDRWAQAMNNKTNEHASRRSPAPLRSLPLADAWLPDMGDTGYPTPRREWGQLTPSEKRKWLAKAILFAALALVLVWKPSSAVRDVVVWSSFLFVLYRKRKSLFSKKPDSLSLAVLAYALIVAASVVYSAHRHWSVRDAGKLLVVLAMVFAAWHLFKSRAFLFGFLHLLVGAVLIVCIWDVVAYLAGLGKMWQWGERWVHGPHYGHPNAASAIIMLLLPVAAFLLVTSRNAWLKAMHGCFLGLGLFLMYVMASRTAQIALGGMIICGAILVRPYKRRIIALAILGCLLVVAFLNVEALNPRFLEDTTKTLAFRQENWDNLSKLIAKRPVFGYGYGIRNYQTVYHRRFISTFKYHHAHSLILQTAFETGIVGVGAILWLWGTAAWRLLKGYSAHRGLFGALCGTLLVSFLGISIYCLAEVPDGFLRSLSWLLVAMTGALTAKEKPERGSGPEAEPPGT